MTRGTAAAAAIDRLIDRVCLHILTTIPGLDPQPRPTGAGTLNAHESSGLGRTIAPKAVWPRAAVQARLASCSAYSSARPQHWRRVFNNNICRAQSAGREPARDKPAGGKSAASEPAGPNQLRRIRSACDCRRSLPQSIKARPTRRAPNRSSAPTTPSPSSRPISTAR